jgi:hypothetical protein
MPSGPQTRLQGTRGGRLGLGGNPTRGSTNRSEQSIVEEEYIADVAGSATFVTTGYAINPGNVTTFPWGNRVAQLYDEYDFVSLEFRYERIASEFNTSASTGEVILSIDYNATDVAPTTLQQVLATRTKNKGMPCDPVIALRADCALMRTQPSKYVLTGAQPAGTDAKTFNAGTLYVSVQGTGTGTLGRLFVKYHCKLKEPVLEPATVAGGVVHFSGTAPTTANNFATAVLQTGGTPSMTGITLGVNTIVFPAGIPGNYLIEMCVGGSTSAAALNNSLGAGITALNLFVSATTRDATPNAVSAASAVNGVSAMMATSVTVAIGGGTYTVTPSTLVGGNNMDLFIVSLPSSLLTQPVLPPSNRELVLEERLARLERLLDKDSDFENEDSESGPAGSSSSAPGLTRSTVDLIGALIARKKGI